MFPARNILLYPASLLYGLITGFRNFLFDAGIISSVSFPVPVISVGNLTVGGTGKTPHTEYLTEILRKDFRVAVLSRGYKRNSEGFRYAGASSKVSEIGDEPLQIYRKYPDALVAVDSDRVNGIDRILKETGNTGVVILDDGFQHRKVQPGLSILLSDYNRPFYRDYMLPYGNLREYRSNMKRADIIVVTKCPKNLNPIQRRLITKELCKFSYQVLFFTSLSYRAPKAVFENDGKNRQAPDLKQPRNSGIVLVTGIANPQPLKDYLMKFFDEIVEMIYPDHHGFSPDDIRAISDTLGKLTSDSRYVITTEKDAVRLMEIQDIVEPLRSALYYIPIGITFLNDEKEEFDKIVTGYVGKNRRDNGISQEKGDN